MNTILITGSKGLIGSVLAKKLRDAKYNVIEIDIAAPKQSDSYGDILNLECLQKKVNSSDGIIHLAAVSRVIWGEKDPDFCNQINIGGTQNVITSALNSNNRPWIIYASSREVYGQQCSLPVSEDATLRPVNIYGHSKYSAEKLMKKHREQGLNTVICRFSNVYGSINDHADRVIPAFCHGVTIGEDLRLDGSQNTFDFTYVYDVVDGITLLINKLMKNPKEKVEDLHFVSGVGTTLRQAAEYACIASGNRCKFIEASPRNYDVAKFYGDPTRARDILGWQTTTGIKEGISKLVREFQKRECNVPMEV